MPESDPADFSTTLVNALLRPEAYADAVQSVEHRETHISHVFLAGRYAYKVKKPIKTPFLDYSTLQERERLCHQELRLDRRFADDLYLDVVPITGEDGDYRVGGVGEAVEFAVKMRRFPDNALLSHWVQQERLTLQHVDQIAGTVADFHDSAEVCCGDRARRSGSFAIENIEQIFDTLQQQFDQESGEGLDQLHAWSRDYLHRYRDRFEQRAQCGAIRECHGDLHLSNLVHWQGKFIPFDGIEFNDDLRFIDVMNDMAFLAMDFAAAGHRRWAHMLINTYLQQRGDYQHLAVLRWFQFYRSLIRAMVAGMKADQHREEAEVRRAALHKAHRHLDLAQSLTHVDPPVLWITHGVSGSGKSMRSREQVAAKGWVQIRSDVERKRMTSEKGMPHELYSAAVTAATYDRLHNLAADLLGNGCSVIVDATFLQRSDRQRFAELAKNLSASFGILHCEAPEDVLRQRIRQRNHAGDDPSDADVDVLQQQLQSREPLDASEATMVVTNVTSG